MKRCFGVVVAVIAMVSIGAAPQMMSAQTHPVMVKDVVISGANELSSSQLAEVKASVLGRTDTSVNLMDTVRHGLDAEFHSACYLRPDIELTTWSADNAAAHGAVMYVTVRAGERYQLRKFRVEWATRVSPKEIEQRLPLEAMRHGDCQALDGIENSVADIYRNHGYDDVIVKSQVVTDKATRQFDLALYVMEGMRPR